MKKRAKKIQTPVTEKDLVKHFEKYQKLIDQLASEYPVLPLDMPDETQGPIYVSEPLFFYQVYTS